MTRQRTAIVVTAILSLLAFGGLYLRFAPEVDPGLVGTIVAGIAGLGGYEVRQRSRAD